MNSGADHRKKSMKAVMGGIIAGLVAAGFCAIVFGVWRGDEAYNSPTIKVTLAICIAVTALTSVKLATLAKNEGSKIP